jgi:hypothetical protein
MVTENDLTDLGFRSLGGNTYYLGFYDFKFNTEDQLLHEWNDQNEDFTCVGKVTDKEQLKEMVKK